MSRFVILLIDHSFYRHILFEKEKTFKFDSLKGPIDKTADVIIEIWNRATIPIIEKQSICKKLKSVFNDARANSHSKEYIALKTTKLFI